MRSPLLELLAAERRSKQNNITQNWPALYEFRKREAKGIENTLNSTLLSSNKTLSLVKLRKSCKSDNTEPLATVSMEVVGEVEPLTISDSFEETSQRDDLARIYEYSWSLGLTGRTGFNWLEKVDEDDAVLVQLILQTYHSSFAYKEVFATLEYLPPTKTLKEQPSIVAMSKKALSGIGEVSKSAGFNLVGSLSTAISNIIPSQDNQGSKWYLNKFHFSLDSGEPVYGIEWHISRRLIQEIGNRLVGRYGLIFLNAPFQSSSTPNTEDTVIIRGRLGLKHCPDEYEGWYDFNMLPEIESESLKLMLKPKTSEKETL